jgi:HEAT repeat protein
MRKLILSLIVQGVFITSFAQTDKDYNPYKSRREDYIKTLLYPTQDSVEGMKDIDNCERGREAIKQYYEILAEIEQTKEKRDIEDYVGAIVAARCPELFEFTVNLIKTDTSEQVRCRAIMLLGFPENLEYVPFLDEYIKKDTLSKQEKYAIAFAFANFGIYENRPDLTDKAVAILDEICYDDNGVCQDYDIRGKCMWVYYVIGNEPAMKFFNSWFEQEEGFRRTAIAVFLAELGEYEKTFPLFVEAIHSEVANNILEAIRGLAVIGTEEALELIREQTKSKNEAIAKQAKWIFDYIEMKRREK